MLLKRQFKCFLKIFIGLKGSKFLWLLVITACLISNNILYIPVARIIGIYGQKYTDVKEANDFVQDNLVLVQRDLYTNEVSSMDSLLRELGTRNSNPSEIFTKCLSPEDCSAQHFDLLYRGSSSYVSIVDFKKNATSIVCNMASGGELYCPFLGYLASIGQLRDPNTNVRFKVARMFRSIGRYQPDGRHVTTEGQTLCDLEAKYPSIFPGVVAAHAVLTVGSMFFYFLASTLVCIYDLKGNGFLQLVVQKGLSTRAYWLVLWAVTTFEVVLCAAILTVSFAAQCPRFYLASDLLKIFGFSLVQFYCIASICLLVTVLARTYAQASMWVGLIAITAMLFNLLNRLLLSDWHVAKLALLFLPPGHLGEYIQAALLAEATRTPLLMYHTITFLVAGCVTLVIFLVTLYLDFVLNTGNGLCLEAGFVFHRSFWCGFSDDENEDMEMPEIVIQLATVEKMKEDLRPVISITNLSKSHGSGCLPNKNPVHALKNITVTIYESHITAIIGHNGAGKTTLMSILTGSQKATCGVVYIDGCALNSPLAQLKLRGKLGICAQNNSLSDSLTVKQTVDLTLTSCGIYPDETEEELISMLTLLHLNEKISNYVGTLSGGQKRKLCIALALLGNPKVVVMDEPTSGVDPVSRRRIWKLLQEYKLGRSIILSTQFMDEADTLADRKILLSGGSLICAGSSLFLKSIFDCGFIFEVTLKSADLIPIFMKRVTDDFNTVKLKKQFRTNLELQVSANELEVLPSFAAFLEKRVDIIAAYGLAQPTLADIFMRLKDLTPKSVETLFNTKTVSLLASDAAVAESLSTLGSQETSALDALESRALTPSTIKRINAILALSIRRIFRMRAKLCLRLIIPVLLLLGLACASIAERVTRDPDQQKRRVMQYEGLQFNRGVCVYDYPNSKDNTTPTLNDCYRLLTAKSGTAGVNFKLMHKEQVTSIESFLEKSDVSADLRKLCDNVDDRDAPCPVFHTDIWSTGVHNAQREANIGMYSVASTSNVSVVAATVMSLYSRTMKYFAGKHSSQLRVRVESVDDFKATLLPLFGAFVQIVILSIIPATYLEDAVEDKETKVRSQLYSMGVTSFNYWITTYVVHWLQYALVYGLSIILLVCILPHNFFNFFYLVGIVMPTLIFGLTNNLLCAYIVSAFMDKFNQFARIAYIFFSLIIGATLLGAQLNSDLGMVLIYALPPFASIALTFYGTKVYFFTDAYYWIEGMQSQPSSGTVYFAHIHVYNSIIAMVCHTGVLIILLSMADNHATMLHRCETLCEPDDDTVYPSSDDPGVIEEADRIEEHRRNDDNILEMRHIRKIYPNNVKAIRDATFGVMSGEIFGLLGPNGAGKTTTLSIIVGDEKTSTGECEIKVKNCWLRSASAAERCGVGYCPQHNPLFPGISIAEHLIFYAKILGIHESLARHDIRVLLQGLNLEEHQAKLVCNLSEGLKRRTCLAISLLGSPSIVIIDEASTGVDPEGKRFIWSAIRSMANRHRALIITTHSMEEAEALCTRVGIMNHGLMVGLGSVAQLINLYGEWYTLDIQIKAELGEAASVVRSRKDRAIKSIVMHFSHTKILEQFTSRVSFSIPSESVPRLSAALAWLVSNKESLQMKYFSFYQLSLDQVFEHLLKTHDEQIQKQRRASVFSVTTQLSEFDNSAFA